MLHVVHTDNLLAVGKQGMIEIETGVESLKENGCIVLTKVYEQLWTTACGNNVGQQRKLFPPTRLPWVIIHFAANPVKHILLMASPIHESMQHHVKALLEESLQLIKDIYRPSIVGRIRHLETYNMYFHATKI